MAYQKKFIAQIVIIERNSNIAVHYLSSESGVTIGRIGGANDIAINSAVVSGQHGYFCHTNGVFTYSDLGSANGTYINGRKINNKPHELSSTIVLKDSDVLTIAPNDKEQVSIIFSLGRDDCTWKGIRMSSAPVINIGRNENNEIYIPNVAVSRRHAVITAASNGYNIQDYSLNGTILNGQRLRGTRPLRDGDIIWIDSTKLFVLNGFIAYSVQEAAAGLVNEYQPIGFANSTSAKPSNNSGIIARKGGIEIKVKNVSREVAADKNSGSGKKKILDNITLTIHKGEFVAILGGSGAGKTTFMNCINGFEGPTEGEVLIDGVELYKNYDSLKSRMGYVPQQDIVHENLTLRDMLNYTGKLRLPKDDIKTTLDKRVQEVIEAVDLTEQTNTLIKKLSGGQRKRASIAVELLSDPQLMFLDEPTSGLDPEAETSLMKQLRKLSDEGGKTVVVVTHTLQNIRLFDKVIFLAPGGKLCFYGAPDEACRFFEVENLTDAYRKIIDNADAYVTKYNRSRQGE